ncbi:methylmalonyl Co-A mutase-associated GTPase MeaB [Sulfolobus acidocaldarius]|uniref:Conserved Archaeal protein n=4 Tax=Sulfolobus acidocaldarius TaxID=2285 RepID=Q4JCI9_SULAC|nr:methylmalonyl Co-A mutase-associated GTPase MeaB [Sulfolobus acidocaldarius]AAY79490.1 conserved Archaeal protein [Sulfolobus acidocaldarius DSM 639]AGE70039.1 LAO/AO transport system ATPase [Sulfolobus acidocaldarius N8]AGE72314.1 LAO/AO transport system ATPase [Sulfolobus acidocaldarius Ron12/I]ALU29534.1 GTPase [Sulfolobus acidocaldarius]ALU32264.1 GTPase [Sulfolobus acidocaldarius]
MSLLDEALKGNQLAIGRLLTKIEYLTPEGLDALEQLMKNSGKAHVIGITGSPGSGKSTLISKLVSEYLNRGHRVGVILIDPSSPFSLGSFMGNRIRLSEDEFGEKVFIRSIGSRGYLGGISSEALMLVEALDGLGFDRILVETVGAGQTDTEVIDTVHTISVLTTPGTGDDIQALKAGIMEIGDIYVINKSDKPETELAYNTIRFAIETAEGEYKDGWKPRIVKTIAIKGVGISELIDAFDEHLRFLIGNRKFEFKVENRRVKILELLLKRSINTIIERFIIQNKNEIDVELNKNHRIKLLIEKYTKIIGSILENQQKA